MGGGIICRHTYKNVLHVANYAAAYSGNFIESLNFLSAELVEQNIKSFYVFPKVNEDTNAYKWIQELKQSGREISFFRNKFIHDILVLRKIIKAKKVKIIHTHFITMKQFMMVKLAAIGTQAKIVMHFHNHSKQAYGVKNFIRKVIYKKCVMIACSDSVYNAVKRDFPDNVKYEVDNGANFDRLKNCVEINRADYGLKEDSILLLIFGFDYYRKGVDIALRALADLNNQNVKYEIIISLSKNHEQIKDEIIKQFGEVPEWVKIISARSDVASLYNMCNIFLSPSREEGMPYSVIEASYCLCSVVISDIPPQQNLKIPYTVYHKSEDPESLKESIEIALAEKDERLKNIVHVRDVLENDYSVGGWAEDVLEVYKKVLEA